MKNDTPRATSARPVFRRVIVGGLSRTRLVDSGGRASEDALDGVAHASADPRDDDIDSPASTSTAGYADAIFAAPRLCVSGRFAQRLRARDPGVLVALERPRG